jgi:hypothetical protein
MALLIIVSLYNCKSSIGSRGKKSIYENTPAQYWNLFSAVDNKNYPWLASFWAIRYGYMVLVYRPSMVNRFLEPKPYTGTKRS